MESILYIIHTQPDGALSKIALEGLSASLALARSVKGASLSIGLFGCDVQAAADQIGGCDAARFIAVSGDDFAGSRYGSDVTALQALVKAAQATIVLAPATSRINRVLPGLAYRIGGRIDTHVCGFEASAGKLAVQRFYYRQRILATLSRTQRPWVLSIDSGTFPAFEGQKAAVHIENVACPVPSECKRTAVVGYQAPCADAQTIRPEAKLLFVAGAGWTKKQADWRPHVKEAESIILEFLKGSQASLGSSKSLVDQSGEGQEVLGFLSHLNQVGQTGSTPRHPKGLATCCHGEEPHVVGWRFINERRAVNLDANCGWAHGKADVLYVADAFQVMARVNELMK